MTPETESTPGQGGSGPGALRTKAWRAQDPSLQRPRLWLVPWLLPALCTGLPFPSQALGPREAQHP